MTYVIDIIESIKPIENCSLMFLFMLGGELRRQMEQTSRPKCLCKKMMFMGCLAVLIMELFAYTVNTITGAQYPAWFGFCNILTAPIICGLFALSFMMQCKGNLPKAVIEMIGKNTMGMYLTHTIIIRVISKYVKFDTGIERVLFGILVFVLSLLTTLTLRKLPIVNKIIKL